MKNLHSVDPREVSNVKIKRVSSLGQCQDWITLFYQCDNGDRVAPPYGIFHWTILTTLFSLPLWSRTEAFHVRPAHLASRSRALAAA